MLEEILSDYEQEKREGRYIKGMENIIHWSIMNWLGKIIVMNCWDDYEEEITDDEVA